MGPPVRQQIAEIIVDRPPQFRCRGSGYQVAPGWVLTANHVVSGASKIGVWFGAPGELRHEDCLPVEPSRVLGASDSDLALLPVDAGGIPTEPALLGRLDRESSVGVTAVAAGFPRFKLRPVPARENIQLRERHDAVGSIVPGSNLKTGTYELANLNLQPAEDPEPAEHSPWEGMSGAAVWAGGRLIGVVAAHHPTEGTGALTVRPVEGLFCEPTADLVNWRNALGRQLPARAWDLWLVAPEGGLFPALEQALGAARELAPNIIEERDAELHELDAFAGGTQQWRWLQGGAFAGKTALIAWFVSHAPSGVDFVSCFLRRTTGENTAPFALDTLNAQLAARAGKSGYLQAAYSSEKKRDFRKLLADAARACSERGRRLVVIIDGADEYDTSATGLRLRDWLPAADSLPAGAALLMSSRTGIDLGLPATNILQRHVVGIAPSRVAGDIEEMARTELHQALADTTGIRYPLTGLLAAAIGGLTSKELAALLSAAGSRVYAAAVETTVATLFRRVLAQSPADEAFGEQRINFAHDMLLAEARRIFADDLAGFEAQLLDWCRNFRYARWPDDTPRYVLSQYPRHLLRGKHLDELSRLVEDRECCHCHMQGDPTGNSYLETINIVWSGAEAFDENEAKSARPAANLGVEVHCALTSASVRNVSSGVSLPLLIALLDCRFWSERRVWLLARMNPDPETRGRNLAQLASRFREPVLSAAVRDALHAVAAVGSEFSRAEMIDAIALHVPESLIADAFRLARSLSVMYPDGTPRRGALGSVLARAASLGHCEDALEEALKLTHEWDQPSVLAGLAPALPAVLRQKALDKVREMRFSAPRARALVAFAAEDASVLQEALKGVLYAEHPEDPSPAIVFLARMLPIEQLEPVLAKAEKMWKPCVLELQAEIAECLAKRGNWSRALAVARGLKAKNNYWYIQALVKVAPRVPESERMVVVEELWSVAKHLPFGLAMAAPILPEPLLRDAVEFARKLPDPDKKAETLAAILPALARFVPQEAFDLAFMTASEAKPRLSQTLCALIPQLPQPVQSRACHEALANATRIGGSQQRIQALAALAPFLSEGEFEHVLEWTRKATTGYPKEEVLKAIIPELPDQLLPKALAVAMEITVKQAIGTEWNPRANVLLALAPRLPEPDRTEALREAGTAIRDAVAPDVPEKAAAETSEQDKRLEQQVQDAIKHIGASGLPQRELIKLLRDAVDCADKIQDPSRSAVAMRMLAPHFPTLMLPTTEWENEQPQRVHQMRVLRAMGPFLERQQLSEAIEVVLNLPNNETCLRGRGHDFESVGPALETLSPADLYPIWRTIVRTISTESRFNMLDVLIALRPVLLKLAGPTGAARMASAIRMTGEWWP